MDVREPLKAGDMIYAYQNAKETQGKKEFLIECEIGRGGSCIVYHGNYVDSIGFKHYVRIKECYPYELNIKRNKRGILCSDKKEQFEIVKEKFLDACKTHTLIRNQPGLVNSTVNVIEIYYGNGTIYSVMDYDEGLDYKKIKDKNIKETLQRIRAVACVLEKYHEAGYLHLDLKPENILVLPETTELVRLFDFDSVIEKENITKIIEKSIFCTPGFSAPEVITGNMEQIGEQSDIYSLGAVLFFKLMERCPGREEREINAVFDLDNLQKKNPACQILLFRKLKTFFSKTLSAACSRRFSCVGEVIIFLDELILLADIETVYPISNFIYHQEHFVGRAEERKCMKEKLDKKHVLFLHGIGGIGKTELAMNYAHEYENDYDRIFFLRYEYSLLDTLCKEDLKLHQFYRGEEEKENDYWKRKLEILKETLSGKDLFILDNFDTEDDEKLEEFLELPCHILITSRCDYRDFNYPQMEVVEFNKIEELIFLFQEYNDKNYSTDEWNAIETMIEMEERHTMAIELLAKNLRDSLLSPIELLERLKKQEGIINIEENAVSQRKDKKRRRISVQNHLKILFDVTDFHEMEYEILDQLSLFSGVRIHKEQFFLWCPQCSSDFLKRLIQRGWIEETADGNMISLHQVILDLIYDFRHPDGEICMTLTKNMISYLNQDMPNRTSNTIRNRILYIFGNRIYRKNIEEKEYPYTTAFYLAYQEKLGYVEEWFDFCQKEYKKYPGLYDDNLAKLYYIKACFELKKLDEFDYFQEDGLQKTTFYASRNDFQTAIEYKKNAAKCSPKIVGDFVFQIGMEWKENVEFNFTIGDEVLKLAYEYIAECFIKGASDYSKGTYDKNRLISMYETLIEFFNPDTITVNRPDDFADLNQCLVYSGLLQELESSCQMTEKRDATFTIHSELVTYTEAGQSAQRKGDYKNALNYYFLALEKGEEDAELVKESIAAIYEKMGEFRTALEYYEANRKELGFCDFHIGRLYCKLGKIEKAKISFQQGIAYCDKKIKEGNNEWKNEKLNGYLEMSYLPDSLGKEAMKKGILYYEQENWTQKEEVLDFQIAYTKYLLQERQFSKLYFLLKEIVQICIEEYKRDKINVIEEILDEYLKNEKDDYRKAEILFLTAALVEEKYPPDYKLFETYCSNALRILEKMVKAGRFWL